jgi:penicillin-binding protein 1B
MELERTAVSNIRKQWVKYSLIGTSILIVLFSIYLSILYRQLDSAFKQENHFVPTRLYSDVSRIAPPALRSQIEARLKTLGYTLQSPEPQSLEFTLHPIEYPLDLIPINHYMPQLVGKKIKLTFETAKPQARLNQIVWQNAETWEEVPEVFLEPEVIATLGRSDQTAKREIRRVVKFADIPAPIWQAIIAIEDPRFLEHKGLDPRGIARAFYVNIRTASLSQGGSTITAQLVKNLMARRTRNIFLKFNELFLSLILETRYSKDTILERYLNEVYLGQVGSYEVHGVAEGAQLFFGKNMDELNLGESAMMAGLIRGPGFYSPYRHPERAKERQKLVLRKMAEAGFIAEAELKDAEKEKNRLALPITVANKAPYFTDYVKAEMIRQLKDKISEEDIAAAGFKVYTTMDTQLNVLAQEAVSSGIADLEKKLKLDPVTFPDERLEGALASVDHKTGFIRALVGGKSYSASTFNRILNMKRQVGSTFKPFVYLTAFLQGQDANGLAYGSGYPVEDAPWTLSYDHGKQKWTPKNYEKEYLGWIPLRTALAKSINTVASKLGVEVGIASVIETAHALGIQSPLPEVPSLTLGVAELSPVELLSAYATIANHGVQDELTVIRSMTSPDGSNFAKFVYNPRQVFPQPPTDLLIDTMRGTFSEGTAISASAMGFDRPAAGKTGTTSSYRDAWFAGFTPDLTTVVWVGTDQNTSLTEKEIEEAEAESRAKKTKKRKKVTLTGASGALPIWVNYMRKALAGENATSFPESPHLVDIRIDTHSGHPATETCPEEQVRSERYMTSSLPTGAECSDHWPESIKLIEN